MALPTPTVLPNTVPYTKFTTTRYLVLPTVAATTFIPTLSEMSAGKDVTPQMTAVSGFSTTTASLDLTLAGNSFTGNLPGRKSAAESSMTFVLSSAGPASDIRAIILEGAVCYVAICNEGLVTSGSMDVWPVRVGSVSTSQDLEAIAMAVAQFYTFAPPAKAVAIPTA